MTTGVRRHSSIVIRIIIHVFWDILSDKPSGTLGTFQRDKYLLLSRCMCVTTRRLLAILLWWRRRGLV